MCYFLTIASPLTLSEVRSMLPPGLAAQPVEPGEAAETRRLLPGAQTVAALLVGACSCDLVHPRGSDSRDDERHLRARYAREGLSRDQVIRRLERHRRRPAQAPSAPWPPQLAAFVAEHARNAGATLYLLQFGDGPSPVAAPVPVTVSLTSVRSGAGDWLQEGQPVRVVR